MLFSEIKFNVFDGVDSKYNTPSNFDEITGGHLIDFDRMAQFTFHYPGTPDEFNLEMLHAFYACQRFLNFGDPKQARNAFNAILFQNKMAKERFGMRPFLTAFIPNTEENAARLCDAIRECWDALYDPYNNGKDSFLRTNFLLIIGRYVLDKSRT